MEPVGGGSLTSGPLSHPRHPRGTDVFQREALRVRPWESTRSMQDGLVSERIRVTFLRYSREMVIEDHHQGCASLATPARGEASSLPSGGRTSFGFLRKAGNGGSPRPLRLSELLSESRQR